MEDRVFGVLLLATALVSAPFAVLLSVARGAMPAVVRRRLFGEGATPVLGAGFVHVPRRDGPFALVPVAVSMIRARR
jgi:hypothetical protein